MESIEDCYLLCNGASIEGSKIIASFISANIEKDVDGSFRIPSWFVKKYGHELGKFIKIRYHNIMWNASYEKDRKKFSGLRAFFRFYNLKMYSVVMFDYTGSGHFNVSCYNPWAHSIIPPSQLPSEFFKNYDFSKNADEFTYGRNDHVAERFIGCLSYNAMRHDPTSVRVIVTEKDKQNSMTSMEISSELANRYKDWKKLNKIVISFGFRMWKVDIKWDGDKVIFGDGWLKYIKDNELVNGDVVSLTTSMNSDHEFLACIFKEKDVVFEKEAAARSGIRGFYKVLRQTTLRHGYMVLPSLVGEQTEKALSDSSTISIYGQEWPMKYNHSLKVIYRLKNLINHYQLEEYDSLHFSFDLKGKLSARIFKIDGMELICQAGISGECFLFEDDGGNDVIELVVQDVEDDGSQKDDVGGGMEIAITNGNSTSCLMLEEYAGINAEIDIATVELDIELIDLDPPEIDNHDGMGDVIAEIHQMENEAQLFQFARSLYGSHVDKRSHGMHLTKEIKFRDREWKAGDEVKFRCQGRMWDIRIVLNHGVPRFSGGWSRFITEKKLVVGDVLLFTLRQNEEVPIFDVQVNPIV